MQAYAAHEFKLSRRLANGTTVRQNLESAAAQRAKRGKPPPPELDGPDLPPAGEHVWGWFSELSSARGSTGFGPAPITYADIVAWARLMAVRPLPWEVRAIKALDSEFIIAASQDKPQQPTNPQQKSKGEPKNAGDR